MLIQNVVLQICGNSLFPSEYSIFSQRRNAEVIILFEKRESNEGDNPSHGVHISVGPLSYVVSSGSES